MTSRPNGKRLPVVDAVIPELTGILFTRTMYTRSVKLPNGRIVVTKILARTVRQNIAQHWHLIEREFDASDLS